MPTAALLPVLEASPSLTRRSTGCLSPSSTPTSSRRCRRVRSWWCAKRALVAVSVS